MSIGPSLREVYIICKRQAIKNVVWFGFATVVTIGVGIVSWWAGFVLFVISALIMAVDVIRLTVIVILDIVLLPINLFSRGRRMDEPDWMYGHLSTLIQLIEALICLAYLGILYLFFWQPSLLVSLLNH